MPDVTTQETGIRARIWAIATSMATGIASAARAVVAWVRSAVNRAASALVGWFHRIRGITQNTQKQEETEGISFSIESSVGFNQNNINNQGPKKQARHDTLHIPRPSSMMGVIIEGGEASISEEYQTPPSPRARKTLLLDTHRASHLEHHYDDLRASLLETTPRESLNVGKSSDRTSVSKPVKNPGSGSK